MAPRLDKKNSLEVQMLAVGTKTLRHHGIILRKILKRSAEYVVG